MKYRENNYIMVSLNEVHLKAILFVSVRTVLSGLWPSRPTMQGVPSRPTSGWGGLAAYQKGA